MNDTATVIGIKKAATTAALHFLLKGNQDKPA